MSKHEKKTSSLLHYPVLVVFSLFFIGLFALDMVTPDRSYSELENTTLSQRPALTQFTAKGDLVIGDGGVSNANLRWVAKIRL